MGIKFLGAQSKEEYFEQLRILSKPESKKASQEGWKLFLEIGPLLVIIGIIKLVVSHESWAIFLVPGLILVYLGFKTKQAILKVWEKNEGFREQKTGMISDEKITITSKESTVDLSWNEFRSYGESKNQIVLFLDDIIFYNFPKSFFQCEADWKQFRSLVAKKLKQSHSLRLSLLQMFTVGIIYLGFFLVVIPEIQKIL